MTPRSSLTWIYLSSLALTLFYPSVVAQADLAASLLSSTTQVSQLSDLQDGDFKFSFINPPDGSVSTVGDGGWTIAANAETFPALISHDIAATVAYIGPCGLNTPHTHPRSSEFNFVVNGTLVVGMLAENGARFVINDVSANHGTVFPAGSIHFEYNDDCQPASLISFFEDADPGVSSFAQRLFGLPADIVGAALGVTEAQAAEIAGMIPDDIAYALEECTQRCGISRDSQPTSQQQSNPSYGAYNLNQDSISGAITSSGSSSNDGDSNRGLIIGLIVAVAVLGLGFVGLAAAALLRRKRRTGFATGQYVRPGERYAPGSTEESEKFNPSRTNLQLRTPYDPPSASV